jgi:hypothetical protein
LRHGLLGGNDKLGSVPKKRFITLRGAETAAEFDGSRLDKQRRYCVWRKSEIGAAGARTWEKPRATHCFGLKKGKNP